MIKKEHANADKVEVIPYIYDFDQMGRLDNERVKAVRQQYPCKFLLIMVSRLTPYKRHMLVLPVVEKLIREGLDIKLLIMDEGPEQIFIEKHIEYKQLSTRIFLPGFKTDILHYIAAADVLLHPSLTEASNSAVKEAGLLKKAVVVCKGVGDFDDYLDHGINGFLVNPNTFAEETAPLIRQLYHHPEEINNLGTRLSQSVRDRFSLNDKVVDLYENL
jgi:glycosyltransferase involved in cell wall biosynthesis